MNPQRRTPPTTRVAPPAQDTLPARGGQGDHFIGVDGGGTRSRAVVGDAQGCELGAADGGPGLIDPADPGRAAASVAAVARAAAAVAGVPLPVRGLWAGLAGAGQTRTRATVEAALRDAGLADQVAVGSDIEAAHADAFGAGTGRATPPGILCIVGTGSSVRAVAPSGEVVRVGGWGQLLGDEGSGYRIGLDGLRAVMRASDGRDPDTSLRAALLDATGVTAPRDFVGWAARASKGEIAALAVRVADEARNGDAVAGLVVDTALDEIRAHLEAVLRRTPPWNGPPVVAFVGGLVRQDSALREAVTGTASEAGCRVHPHAVVPERGALRIAAGLGVGRR